VIKELSDDKGRDSSVGRRKAFERDPDLEAPIQKERL
jgi:hypothetical protein